MEEVAHLADGLEDAGVAAGDGGAAGEREAGREGGEEDFVTLSTWGEPTRFDFEPRDHLQLGEALDLFDEAIRVTEELTGEEYHPVDGTRHVR